MAVLHERMSRFGLLLLLLCVGCASAEDECPMASRHMNASIQSAPRSDGPQPKLLVFRKRGRDIEDLKPGDLAHRGDLVQVAYEAAGNREGVVISIDGDGEVTLHHPPEPGGTTRIRPRGQIPLEHAFELDGACAFERFVFVTSDGPIDPRAVIDAARATHRSRDPLGPLPLPSTWDQISFVLSKEGR